MKRLPVLIFILLSIVFLGITIPVFVLNPSLYTVYEQAFTPYHSDPNVLRVYSGEQASDVSARMQELLNTPEPIILNVKASNFEEAERELMEYKEKSQYFNRVIINLDLSNSTIGDFQRESRKNLAALERIINESAQFDQINRLEIQYRSEDDPALLYSITYQGEAVQNAIEKSAKEYIGREPRIIELGNQLELNTTNYKESGEILKDLLEIDQVHQETRDLNKPTLNISSLSLTVSPDSGHYGETLQVTGAYTFMLLPEVTLQVDGKDWKKVVPDQNGIFGSPLTIGLIDAGSHHIFATSNNRYSNTVSFSVVPINPNLSLTILPGTNWNEIDINGSLTADLQPVIHAPVSILVDGFEFANASTNENGYYSTILVLPPGNHTIQSSFDDPGFPLLPALSELYPITISSANRLLWTFLIGAGIIILSLFISMWYLQRTHVAIETISSEPAISAGVPVSEEGIMKLHDRDRVRSRYKELIEHNKWSEAANLLYRSLIERINVPQGMPTVSAMTPREFSIFLSKCVPETPIMSFIKRYEEIRYGGFPLSKQDTLLTDWMEIFSRFGEEINA
jgi:hypothetical protein